jgi:tetratricopeptide (TPR) repeat protein
MEELIDAVRRDPASAFIQLGEAYLALGRPKDVLEVCNVGLTRAPEHVEGRVLLARAHCALHQWKEAQGELLRVVKVDRANRLAFGLLGEVLLRRGDVERAVPVLQHAQNLDPTSPHILTLLKRARSGEALDPPEPVPTAVLPRDVAVVQASAPTRMHQAYVEPEPPPPPKPRPVPAPAPVPVPSIEGVRPRLISANKPQNAAAAALRQSAAVGENYLNELLTGGLLDVAGVRLPDVQYDLRPDRRWGRSARRSFVVLFLLLFMGLGGGGAWYYWTEKQKTIAVARLQREAQEQLTDGSYSGLEASVAALSTALTKDNDNPLTMAFVAEAAGFQALLYGTEVAPVERAIRGASSEITDPAEPGYRELLLGKVASKLAQVPDAQAKTTTLYEALALLDGYLKAHQDDRWAVWLKGRAQQLAGERKAAVASMKQAADGDGGLIVAKIDLADLAADDGLLDEALAQYDAVNKLSKDHPLALLGKSLARAENDVESTQAFDDLNVKLDKPLGPRVAAYRQLALAFANLGQEDYQKAKESAVAAKGVSDARFQVRRAWLELRLGNLGAAVERRKMVQWFGKGKPEPDPSAILVDAGLEVAPDKALELTKKLVDLRARQLAAWASIDLERPKEALVEAEAFLAKAPESLEGKALRDYCKMVSGSAKDREEASASLEKLTRGAKSKVVQHLLGQALARLGKFKEAQSEFEQALAEMNDEHPHPLVYRTRTLLAQLLIPQGKLEEAGKQLVEALKVNPGFLPARATQGQLLLKAGKVDEAFALLKPFAEGSSSLPPPVALAWAEVLVSHKGATDQDKQAAAEILTKLKDAGAPVPAEELARVSALIDPKQADKGPKRPKPRRRHR